MINEAITKKRKHIVINKNAKNNYSKKMWIYIGLHVIACVTNEHYDICNSEQYRVTKFNKACIGVERLSDKTKIDINLEDFYALFLPAYAITAHKSQGMTFDFKYTIMEFTKMSTRMKYVAMSRGTKVENISIID